MKTLVKNATQDELLSYFPTDILVELGFDPPKVEIPKSEPAPIAEPVKASPKELSVVSGFTEGTRARDRLTGQIGTIKVVQLFGNKEGLTLVFDDGTESPDCYYPDQLEVA
jgi:hypothetical protein